MAVLEIVVGLFWLSGGLLALLLLVGANPYGVAGFAGLGVLSFAIGLLGTVLLLLGLVSLGVGIGMWTGRGWALTLGRVFSAIGVYRSVLGGVWGHGFGRGASDQPPCPLLPDETRSEGILRERKSGETRKGDRSNKVGDTRRHKAVGSEGLNRLDSSGWKVQLHREFRTDANASRRLEGGQRQSDIDNR